MNDNIRDLPLLHEFRGVELRADGGSLLLTSEPGVLCTGVNRLKFSPDAPFLDQTEQATLEQFFAKQRDEHLGRWRSEPQDHHVLYISGVDADGLRTFLIIDERDGASSLYRDSDLRSGVIHWGGLASSGARITAEAYVREHPRVEHPCAEAQHGEVWEITLNVASGPVKINVLAYLDTKPTTPVLLFKRANGSDILTLCEDITSARKLS